MVLRFSIVAVALLGVAAPSATQAKPAASSPLVEALDRCRNIADAAPRLTCFDRAAGDLVAATNSGNSLFIDRAQMRQVRRSMFGFTMPKLPFFAGDRSAEEQQSELETTVKASRAVGHGRYVVRIAEGSALWETTETYGSMLPPRAGQKVLIRRGALGSYLLRFEGERWIKGKRVS